MGSFFIGNYIDKNFLCDLIKGILVIVGWGYKLFDFLYFRLNIFVILLVLNVLLIIWSCGRVGIYFVRIFLGLGWEKDGLFIEDLGLIL